MFELLPVTPLSAALGTLIVETRLLHDLWPIAPERKVLERALADTHRDLHALIVVLGTTPRELDESASATAHEAYLSALCIAVLVKRLVERARGRKPVCVPSTSKVSAAAARVLDLLDHLVERKDVAMRRVMLDGEPMDKVSAAIALPA